jgi:hypothetical protein
MKRFLKAGHFPTLVAALLYFDVSFMAWILLGPLGPFLRGCRSLWLRRCVFLRDAGVARAGYPVVATLGQQGDSEDGAVLVSGIARCSR